MSELNNLEQQGKIHYRDVRNQLTKNSGFGTNYPLAEIEVQTRELGGLPNTETILYSKVGYGLAEEIYIPHPQEDTTYELVELNPLEKEEEGYLPVGPEGKAVSLPHGSSSIQPRLILMTPAISQFERTFSIKATANNYGLERTLDKIIKVQSGVNENLDVTVDLHNINYGETVTITILKAQADCEYVLVTGMDTEEKQISEIEYSIEGRDAELTSFPLMENTNIRIFARFRTSKREGYLKQETFVNVYPNTRLEIQAVNEKLDYCSEESVEEGFSEIAAQIELNHTQESVSYQAFFAWVASTAPPVPFKSKSEDFQEIDWGTSQIRGGVASEAFQGTGSNSLILSLDKRLPEDVRVKIIASKVTNEGTIISNTLQKEDPSDQGVGLIDHEVRFKIYPSELPSIEQREITVDTGQSATIRIVDAQIGAHYRLYNKETDEEVGLPYFITKKKTIGLGIIGVDFGLSTIAEPDDRIVEFITDPIHEETIFYVKVVKPINELELRFVDEITVKINE